MTTLITTIQRTGPKQGIDQTARRLAATLAALVDTVAAWSARQYPSGIGDVLEAMPPGRRIDAALRWHARQRHVL